MKDKKEIWKDKIPKGTPYCYESKGWKKSKKDGLYLEIESCPYYKHSSGVLGHCILLKCDILDQVKECNY